MFAIHKLYIPFIMKPTENNRKHVHFIAWVYIMTDATHSVLYIGSTINLTNRVWEHQTKRNPKAFTAQYVVRKLVYYQGFLSISEARQAESYMKRKTRAWKKGLIEKKNPKWKDLSKEVESDRFRQIG
jgi:putative endonuclease